jgi:SET domain-containing protein
MMLVRSFVAPSDIQGLGVFAGEFIAKGSRLWGFEPKFDICITPEEFDALSGLMQEYVERYSYPHLERPGVIVLDCDHGKFMNHSDAPNTDFTVFDSGYALRDIFEGEEITCNYFEFIPAFRGFGAAAVSEVAVSVLDAR